MKESCWAVEQMPFGNIKSCRILMVNVLNEDKHCTDCKFYKTKEQKAQGDYQTETRLAELGYVRGAYPLRFK